MREDGSEVSRARSKGARTFTSARWTRGMRARARRGGARGRSRSRRRCDSRRSPRGDVVFLLRRGTRGRTCLEMRRLVSFAAGAARAERAMQAMVAMDVPGVFLAERGGGMPARTATAVPLGTADIVSRDLISAGSALRFLRRPDPSRGREARPASPRARRLTPPPRSPWRSPSSAASGSSGGCSPRAPSPPSIASSSPSAKAWCAQHPDPTRPDVARETCQIGILLAPHAPSIPRPLTRPLPPPLPPSPPASSPAR